MGEQGDTWRRPSLALAAVSFVLFLTFLDNTIVTVVLGSVQMDLHAGVAGLQWVVNGYALVFASFMLTFGAFGDLFGRKKVMMAGVAVFIAGSLLGALAPNVPTLVAARAVMGLGAAASEPGTLSMIRQAFPDDRRRAFAYGVWAAVSAVALALGPVIGGVLAGLWSWRAVFWFNVFFGLVALAAAQWTLHENSDPDRGRLDVVGAVLGALALGCASFAVISGETAGYRAWWIVTLFAAAAVSGVAFVFYELRDRNPVLNVRYLRLPPFAASNLIAFSTYFSTFAIFLFVTLYLEQVGSTSNYGLAADFVPMSLAMVVAALVAGKWVGASGPRAPIFLGCVLAGFGVLLTDLELKPTAGFAQVGWTLAITGIGFGLTVAPLNASAMAVIPARSSSMAASMTNTSREMGAVAGVAVLGSIVNAQLTVNLARRLAQLGIPKAFRQAVVNAVTTGSFNSQASKAVGNNVQLLIIVHKVLDAAYRAFANGLDIALYISTALMFLSALVTLVAMHERHGPMREASVAASA